MILVRYGTRSGPLRELKKSPQYLLRILRTERMQMISAEYELSKEKEFHPTT